MVEDNDGVRRAMAHGLERAGHRVVAAADGNDARIQLARRDDWDALCTDAVMPGYASTELIADFQARFPGRPVVLCSGHLPQALSPAFEGLELRFLAKPFSPSTLVEIFAEELTR
jgi:DNA-binding NtrC family response regulator